MMNQVLSVDNLCKAYPSFKLDNVSFNLEKGKITGFIGRNGAGKTTTLKCLLNFISYDSGNIRFFGREFSENELEIKQNIAFVLGGVNYYTNKKLKKITAVTKSFYRSWDDDIYKRYMQKFSLDENKTPAQLSEGMKVKYNLCLALSHNAQLLILDEPTGGLDPVSRDEILDIFMELSQKGITILFSTHITSDLEKCADNIIYIKGGKVIARNTFEGFADSYNLVEVTDIETLSQLQRSRLIGCKPAKKGFCALIKKQDADLFGSMCKKADLESIMIHIEKEDD